MEMDFQKPPLTEQESALLDSLRGTAVLSSYTLEEPIYDYDEQLKQNKITGARWKLLRDKNDIRPPVFLDTNITDDMFVDDNGVQRRTLGVAGPKAVGIAFSDNGEPPVSYSFVNPSRTDLSGKAVKVDWEKDQLMLEEGGERKKFTMTSGEHLPPRPKDSLTDREKQIKNVLEKKLGIESLSLEQVRYFARMISVEHSQPSQKERESALQWNLDQIEQQIEKSKQGTVEVSKEELMRQAVESGYLKPRQHRKPYEIGDRGIEQYRLATSIAPLLQKQKRERLKEQSKELPSLNNDEPQPNQRPITPLTEKEDEPQINERNSKQKNRKKSIFSRKGGFFN